MDAATCILENATDSDTYKCAMGISGLEYLYLIKNIWRPELSRSPPRYGPSLVCPIEGPVKETLHHMIVVARKD